ncbi:MAG: hypothetical protein EHM12_12295, partial [Dehalococcoidia bacterium]
MKNRIVAAGRRLPVLLFAVFLALSLVIPAHMVTPQPAEAGIMKWDTIQTPAYDPARNDILRQSEIDRFVVGPSGNMLVIVTKVDIPAMSLMSSNDG